MARQIALLRGINVGKHKRLPMARLRELIEELGHDDVRTYVQSGNVVFTAARGTEAELVAALEQAIEAAFGFAVPVMVRSRDALADVVAANPLRDVATDPARQLVVFCAADVDPERLAGIAPADFAPEAFAVRGREIHLWAPGGVHGSHLARALSDERLGGTGTARNWRTVERLLAMADEGS